MAEEGLHRPRIDHPCSVIEPITTKSKKKHEKEETDFPRIFKNAISVRQKFSIPRSLKKKKNIEKSQKRGKPNRKRTDLNFHKIHPNKPNCTLWQAQHAPCPIVEFREDRSTVTGTCSSYKGCSRNGSELSLYGSSRRRGSPCENTEYTACVFILYARLCVCIRTGRNATWIKIRSWRGARTSGQGICSLSFPWFDTYMHSWIHPGGDAFKKKLLARRTRGQREKASCLNAPWWKIKLPPSIVASLSIFPSRSWRKYAATLLATHGRMGSWSEEAQTILLHAVDAPVAWEFCRLYLCGFGTGDLHMFTYIQPSTDNLCSNDNYVFGRLHSWGEVDQRI